MKKSLAIIMLAAAAQAQEWTLCVQGNSPITNAANGAAIVRWDVWRSDDVQDWVRAGSPQPNRFPALYHGPTRTIISGITAVDDATKARCLALAYEAAGGTNVLTDWGAAISNAVVVTGGQKSLAGLKNRGKNIPTSKERDYYMATVDALVARIQMLEASMRRAGLVVPGDVIKEETP